MTDARLPRIVTGSGNTSSESTDFLPQKRRATTGTSSGGTEQSTQGA